MSAEAGREEALLFYQQTILNALRETNDALTGSQKKRASCDAQLRRVGALRNYSRLSRVRFDNGAASYVEVLVAENDLFSAELTAVNTAADALHAGRSTSTRRWAGAGSTSATSSPARPRQAASK
jgi:multidrug efflux system outer membrane protein